MIKKEADFDTGEIEKCLKIECIAMIIHIMSYGLKTNSDLVKKIHAFIYDQQNQSNQPADMDKGSIFSDNVGKLILLHHQLSGIVAPVTPRSIVHLEKECRKDHILKFVSSYSIIRQVIIISIVSIITLLAISIFPEVDPTLDNWGYLNSSGWAQLLRILYILSASSIGVSFYMLYSARKCIELGLFDIEYHSILWIQYIQGVIAGFLLGMLIPIETFIQSDFSKPMMALIGGFSSDLVYQILHKLVNDLKSLVRGDSRGRRGVQKAASVFKMSEEYEEENIHEHFKAASEGAKTKHEMNDLKIQEIEQQMAELTKMLTKDSGN